MYRIVFSLSEVVGKIRIFKKSLKLFLTIFRYSKITLYSVSEMNTAKQIIPLKILPVISILFLASCATTWGVAKAVPEIYLVKSDITMELKKEAFAITAIGASRDGRYLITGDNGGAVGGEGTPRIRLWDMIELKQILSLIDLSGTVKSIDISPDGRYAIVGGIAYSGSSDNPKYALSIWDLSTGKLFKTFERSESGDDITNVSFSQDGKYFLITTLTAGTAPKTDIRIFDTNKWSLVKTLIHPKEPGYSDYLVATFSPDGKYILSGGPASILRLWNIESGKEIKTLIGHKQNFYGGVCSIAFSPDGKYALSSGWYDEYVRLWDIEKGSEVIRYFSTRETERWYGAYVLGVAVSPDWKNALILSHDSKLYDINTGLLIKSFRHLWKGLKTMVGGSGEAAYWWPVSGRYHPNGQYILMTMTDAAVRIYDAKTGDEIAVLIGFEDGEWLAITSEGYYNSSEKGAQYISIKVGETSYSVDSFYDVFYRPDIVIAKLRGEDIKGLITITMKDAIKSPPPVVEISPIPTSQASSKTKVCYQVKSTGGGIGEVRLFHNGKLIQSDGFYKEITRSASDRTQLASLNSNAIYADMRSVSVKSI
ncbi:MAG: hypothetical protein FJ139_02675, partial [Deltaproteobacteria bacterium]|nr:hypothetical protein [Deltaproteobacteria bacterium]